MSYNSTGNNRSSGSSIRFRIAIVGSNRVRVAKVVSLLLSASSSPPPSSSSSEDDAPDIQIEYIPCVATFDSYEDQKGQTVKYLMKLEHHENEGRAIRGSSLAPFFDEMYEEERDVGDDGIIIPGLAVVAIGCGIETEEEVEMISSFLNVLSSNSPNNNDGDGGGDNNGDGHDMIINCIQPNPEFTTMVEENKAYKSLDAQEKLKATEQQSMGPGKMAKFVNALAQDVIERYSPSQEETIPTGTKNDIDTNENTEKESTTSRISTFEDHGSAHAEACDGDDTCTTTTINDNKITPPPEEKVEIQEYYDATVTRFACKICRSILFSQNELEDPPHIQSQHDFTSHKSRSASRSTCQSVFLESGLDWMGDISSSMEGKIVCYKCHNKLGIWKWAGAQCSCGTWVTPAIQIHLSRVDIIPPIKDNIGSGEGNTASGTPVSPLAALHVAGITNQR